MVRSRAIPIAAALLAGALLACDDTTTTDLLLASTTSTEDSGLFEVLLPAFMEAHPAVRVRLTAVGTGQALELGRRRDADVLVVHAPPAESAFVADGYGVGRCDVMYNDYVLVGPSTDPAGVANAPEVAGSGTATARDVAAAFRRIAATRAPFVSRGDDSGTHQKEQSLWADAGVEPEGDWYLEVGQGMAEVLLMALEREAYTLTDRATYRATYGVSAGAESGRSASERDTSGLAVLLEGDPRLFNQYGVIPVAGSPRRAAARVFAEWLTGPDAQRLIGEYGTAGAGEPLFVANAGECSLPDADAGTSGDSGEY